MWDTGRNLVLRYSAFPLRHFRLSLFGKFLNHYVLSDGTERRALSRFQSDEMNIKYFISPSGNRTHNRRAYNQCLCPCATTIYFLFLILLHRNACFVLFVLNKSFDFDLHYNYNINKEQSYINYLLQLY